MVGEGWDWYICSEMVTTMCFSVTGGVKVQSCVGPCPLFTPRLSEFGLIWAIHSISTLLISCYKYNEWFCKVEIWVHHVQPSPHPGFWVMGGVDFGFRPLRFTPRWSMFGLIQEVHSISTFPTPHYKYDEWLQKVEIGTIWALKRSPQRVFQSRVGSKLACPLSTFHTKIEWVWTDWGSSQHHNPSNILL